MTISLLESIERWLNILPPFKNSNLTQSPALLLEGRSAPSFSRPRLPFGAYAMAYTGTDNTMDPRATPSIALRESNDSNGFFFMSLDTGKRLHCNSITPSPSTSDNSAILSTHLSSIPDDTSSIHSYTPHQDDDLPFNDESIQDSINDSSPIQDSIQDQTHDSSPTQDSNPNHDSNQDTTGGGDPSYVGRCCPQ